MTTNELYEKLKAQAMEERGSSQVWHHAEIDGHMLYMADTSFGDGPTFRMDRKAWQISYDDAPIYRDTTEEDLLKALELAERATWVSRFEQIEFP